MKEEKIKKEDLGVIIRVHPLLIEVFEKQRKIVQDVTYNSISGSNYEISEIIAKKILNAKIIK